MPVAEAMTEFQIGDKSSFKEQAHAVVNYIPYSCPPVTQNLDEHEFLASLHVMVILGRLCVHMYWSAMLHDFVSYNKQSMWNIEIQYRL